MDLRTWVPVFSHKIINPISIGLPQNMYDNNSALHGVSCNSSILAFQGELRTIMHHVVLSLYLNQIICYFIADKHLRIMHFY